MTRALVLSEHDLGDWARRYRAGEASSPLPYGVDALQALGWSIIGARRSRSRVGHKLAAVAEHRSGIAVDRTLHGFGEVRRSDLVLALLEREGMLSAQLRRHRVPPWSGRPVVIWSCWLADDVRSADAAGRERIRRRIEGADLITHMSRHETEILTDLGIPESRLHAVGFGISQEYFTPDDTVRRDIDVLAVGQDRGRDYATLIEAVRGSGLHLDVVCKPDNLTGIDLPANVRVHAPVQLRAYRELLRRAKVVAVPTHDLSYPTGQSVALEAASTGACVVVTGTRAMREYFTDDVDAALTEVGDVAGWRGSLAALLADPDRRARLGHGGRRSVADRFNTRRMWTDVAKVLVERGLVSGAAP